MNSVNLIGRLTKEPQVRYTGDGLAVASFTLAVDRPAKKGEDKQADFPRIIVFGKQAENCEKYLAKGRLVAIMGRIQTGSYEKQNGDKVYTTDVIADRVQFLEWGEDKANSQAPQKPTQTQQEEFHGFRQVKDDLPF